MTNAKELYNRICQESGKKELSNTELLHLQRVLLNAYLDIQAVCEKNKIRIMLGGGSCLGAVRHSGFIPWDDDLDANMPRVDYERFSAVFNSELGDKYCLIAPNHGDEDTLRFPVIRIKGTSVTADGSTNEMKIDLFIIENVSKRRIAQKCKGVFCHALMLIASSAQMLTSQTDSVLQLTKDGRRFLKRRLLIARLFSFMSPQYWLNAVDKVCQYKNETGMVSIPTGRNHYFGEMQPVETFFPLSKGVFEGCEVNLPNNPHAYLSKLYGSDYMMPPPPEKREKHYIEEINFGEY